MTELKSRPCEENEQRHRENAMTMGVLDRRSQLQPKRNVPENASNHHEPGRKAGSRVPESLEGFNFITDFVPSSPSTTREYISMVLIHAAQGTLSQQLCNTEKIN